MPLTDPTFVGQVASVTGAVVRVRLREDMPSTLLMIGGESHRVGQIGGFFRVPLGYTNLYAVCTQIGADAAPIGSAEQATGAVLESDSRMRLSGYRWMTIVLFGEGLGGEFERGIGQYPTVGDEVHLVTNDDLKIIHGWSRTRRARFPSGRSPQRPELLPASAWPVWLAAMLRLSGPPVLANPTLSPCCLKPVSDGSLPNARVIVIDPHGEYATALGSKARVFRIRPDEEAGEKPLQVPFWALPFSELQELTLGGLQPQHEASIRDQVLDMKAEAAKRLKVPTASWNADSGFTCAVQYQETLV